MITASLAWIFSQKQMPVPKRIRYSILNSILIVLFQYGVSTALAQPFQATGRKTSLEISENNASVLQHLQDYPELEVLSISCLENLQSLPESIGTLTKLRELIIDNGNGCIMNPLLPESIGRLHSLKKLVLYGAQDPRYFPEEGISPLLRKRHKFPKSMSQLKNLVYLDLGRNGLSEIPEFVKDLPNLRELRFGWNMNLKTLPAFLTGLRELRTLALDANGLGNLPDFLNQLPNLTRITLGGNCLITQHKSKIKSLQSRFPKINFNFEDEYECPTN
jgi:Leucine-rich repeat (LRR) protein